MPIEKTLLRKCPVCGGERGEVLHTQQFALFDDYPLPPVYDVAVCTTCGMIFADTPATQADYDQYYTTSSIYQDPTVSAGTGTADWDVQRLKESVELMARILPSKQARILDIGCANGGLLQTFQAAGYSNVVGVDPSPGCVANARAKGAEAYRGTLSALPPEVGKCDLVILGAVLEHVLDVKAAIRAMLSVCSPQGKIFLEVPDAAVYADHLYAPFQDFNTEHINHFSPACLDNLLGQFGYTCCLREHVMLYGESGFGFPSLEAGYAGGGVSPSAPTWKVDADFRKRMETYIEKSDALMASLNRQIEAALARSKDVIVWGTGQLAMKLLCQSALAGANIVAYVDGNSVNHGRKMRGLPVSPPGKVNLPGVPVLVTTLLHVEPIRARIRSLGWLNPVITLSAE